MHTLAKCYCKNLEIKVAISSFQVKNLMNVKDFVPQSFRSRVIYKFNFAGCNSVYVGMTSWHLSTRMHEHLYSDKNSQIFKHLKSSDTCRKSYGDNCFTVITARHRKTQEKPITNLNLRSLYVGKAYIKLAG